MSIWRAHIHPPTKLFKNTVSWRRMCNSTGMCQCNCGLSAPPAKRNDKRRGVKKGEAQRFVAGHQSRGLYRSDIKGQRFGKLVVVEPVAERRNGAVLWLCRCDCGKDTLATVAYLRNGKISCGCARRRKHQFGDPGFLEYKMLCSAKERAKSKKIKFNLTINDIGKIPAVCPLLGIPLVKNKGRVGFDSPSIDRIDNSKGYVCGNVWIISYKANTIKRNYSLDEFRKIVHGWETKLSSTEKTDGFIYLASPYTHSDKQVEIQRYDTAVEAYRWLYLNYPSTFFFSPIIYSHPISAYGKVPGNWEFWANFDRAMISRALEVWVLCVSGFKSSIGINAERELATRFCMPIRFLVPNASGGYDLTDMEPQP